MRRRRLAVREPSGRPSRAGTEPEYSPAEVRRLRDAAMRGLRDPEWGTELGRLYLEGKITGPQYAAGRRWRRDAANYQQAIGVAPVHSVNADGGRSTPADPDSAEGRELAKREAKVFRCYLAAAAILEVMGAEKVVRGVVERDEAICGASEALCLKWCLSALARHYGFEGGGNGKEV